MGSCSWPPSVGNNSTGGTAGGTELEVEVTDLAALSASDPVICLFASGVTVDAEEACAQGLFKDLFPEAGVARAAMARRRAPSLSASSMA